MTDVEIDYLEAGAGPGITELPSGPEPPPTGEMGPGDGAPLYPGWEQETVEQFLRGAGAGIHMLIGQSERDWLMTKADLDRIGPPLTRIANRWEPALRLSPIADPLLVAHGFALYGWRSALERQRALKDKREADLERDGYVYDDVDVAGGEPATAAVGAEDGEEQLLDDEPAPAAMFPESPRARGSQYG